MVAQSYCIVGKWRTSPIALASLDDFKLSEDDVLNGEVLLANPHINLYSLDLQSQAAVFVETPPNFQPSESPFLYLAQYESAIRVFTLPLAEFMTLSRQVTVNPQKIIWIHSVGRAGSTLAGQLYASQANVRTLSEPDALTVLVAARQTYPDQSEQFEALLQAVILWLCKSEFQGFWVIKGRSFVIELADWLSKLFPGGKHLFLYRHAERWLGSWSAAASTFLDSSSPARRRKSEQKIRASLMHVVPALTRAGDRHLCFSEILALMWLSIMERYFALYASGLVMLAIPYRYWQESPQKTAVAMMRFCCIPQDIERLEQVLTKDSQAGTFLSQSSIQESHNDQWEADLMAFNRQLQEHGTIYQPDVVVPGTLVL